MLSAEEVRDKIPKELILSYTGDNLIWFVSTGGERFETYLGAKRKFTYLREFMIALWDWEEFHYFSTSLGRRVWCYQTGGSSMGEGNVYYFTICSLERLEPDEVSACWRCWEYSRQPKRRRW